MPAPETMQSMAGNLKVVYGKTLIQTLPDSAVLQKRFPLADSADYPLVGDYFSALVSVQSPWGFSYLGAGTENTATNYTLADALVGQTLPAKVYGNTTVLADNISYQMLDRAAKSGPQAVMSALTLSGKQMALSARNNLEIQALHGRQGIGAASANIATLTVTFDGATTSAGILCALVGARVQFFQSNLTTARTTHDSSNYLTVSSVDVSNLANPTVTLVATGTTGVANIVTGDVMFLGGSRGISVAAGATSVPFYEQIGLGLQLAETSALVFDISKSTYPNWKSNQMGSVGTFTPSALMQSAAIVMGRGGELGKYIAVVSPRAWSVISSSLQTQEIFDKPREFSVSKDTGTDKISVNHAGISIELLPHPFQKDGQCYLLPESQVKRIGSVDLTFSIPGRAGEEEFYFPVNNQAAMQRQCRADWQMAVLKPSSACILTGITY